MKPRKPVNKVSAAKKERDKVYAKLRRAYLRSHERCEACSIVRPGKSVLYAIDIHHRKKRGEYELDVSTFMGVCRSCHNFIHADESRAKQLGLLET